MTTLPPEVRAANRRRTIVVLAILVPLVVGLAVADAVLGSGHGNRVRYGAGMLVEIALGPGAAIWALVELVARVRSRARGTWSGRIWPWVALLADALLATVTGAIGLAIVMSASGAFAALVLRAGGVRRRPPPPPDWPPPAWPPPGWPPPGWPGSPYPPPPPPPPAWPPPPEPPTPPAPPTPPEPPEPPAAHAAQHRRRACRARRPA